MSDSQRPFVVVIDGPAASGKSTTARIVSNKMNWLMLDTGAMYRAIAVYTVQQNVALSDSEKIGTLANQVQLDLEPSDNGVRVFLNDQEVTEEIRTPEIDKAVSPVCEIPKVRDAMVSLQRKIAEGHSLVAEGRDMGTVVFPNADLKFYMDASIEARAMRRKKDMEAKGIDISLQQLKEDIAERDRRDSSRDHSPLKPAEDAIHLDTTKLSIDEQVEEIMTLINKKLN